MADQKIEGGCQCGAIRYTAVGDPILAAVCHCAMCRRAHAAPAVAWAMYAQSRVLFSGERLEHFQSSEQAQRGFCPTCGTQICFTASFLPQLIDISLGSLDDPESIKPSTHCWHASHLSWAEFADNLPRYPELPPFEEGGG